MPSFIVTCEMHPLEVTVEATDEDDAIDKASDAWHASGSTLTTLLAGGTWEVRADS